MFDIKLLFKIINRIDESLLSSQRSNKHQCIMAGFIHNKSEQCKHSKLWKEIGIYLETKSVHISCNFFDY